MIRNIDELTGRNDQVCAACGTKRRYAGGMCPMSDEGEGPHEFENTPESIGMEPTACTGYLPGMDEFAP